MRISPQRPGLCSATPLHYNHFINQPSAVGLVQGSHFISVNIYCLLLTFLKSVITKCPHTQSDSDIMKYNYRYTCF